MAVVLSSGLQGGRSKVKKLSYGNKASLACYRRSAFLASKNCQSLQGIPWSFQLYCLCISTSIRLLFVSFACLLMFLLQKKPTSNDWSNLTLPVPQDVSSRGVKVVLWLIKNRRGHSQVDGVCVNFPPQIFSWPLFLRCIKPVQLSACDGPEY